MRPPPTFTCDSIPSVAVRAAATPEGPGDGGLTGDTGEAGGVSAGHTGSCRPPLEPRGEVGGQLRPAGLTPVDGGSKRSSRGRILLRCCGFPVRRRNIRPPVGGSSV